MTIISDNLYFPESSINPIKTPTTHPGQKPGAIFDTLSYATCLKMLSSLASAFLWGLSSPFCLHCFGPSLNYLCLTHFQLHSHSSPGHWSLSVPFILHGATKLVSQTHRTYYVVHYLKGICASCGLQNANNPPLCMASPAPPHLSSHIILSTTLLNGFHPHTRRPSGCPSVLWDFW